MSYSDSKSNPIYVDVILFIVRLFIGFAMISHGFSKLQLLFNNGQIQFFEFLGLSSKISLILAIFGEFVCSIFLILGLFSRMATGFLIVTMIIIGFIVHGNDGFDKRELSLIYLSVYLLLITFGAGRISVDYMIKKRRSANNW